VPTRDSNGLYLLKSEDYGASWNPYTVIVESDYTEFEDKQWMAIDRSGGQYDGNIYVTWTGFPAGGGF
jgi:hypothetical protein